MPKFPKREADILALADAMLAGYIAHVVDFPSSERVWLLFGRYAYINVKNDQTDALAAAQIATEQKDAKLAALVELMKAMLKKSEVDVGDSPEKLEYIGWGPKALSAPTDPPGQPRNLHPVAEGQGILWLTWDSPVSGGPVRNYVVERRQQPAGGGEFGDWAIVGTALNNEINLNDQPRGVQLEYCAKAINTGGESPPSNTAAVVL